MEGCLKWQAEGLGNPVQVQAATEAYQAEMDPLADFLEECCELTASSRTPSQTLYATYIKWCGQSGERALSMRKLGPLLRAVGCEPRKSGGLKVWHGVGLV